MCCELCSPRPAWHQLTRGPPACRSGTRRPPQGSLSLERWEGPCLQAPRCWNYRFQENTARTRRDTREGGRVQEGTRNGQTIRLLLRQDKRYRSAGHRRPVRRRQNNPQNSLHCGPAGSPERGVSTTHGTSGLGAVAVLERENPGRSHKPSAGLLAPAARPPHRALHRGHRSAAAAPGGDCAAPGRSGWGGGARVSRGRAVQAEGSAPGGKCGRGRELWGANPAAGARTRATEEPGCAPLPQLQEGTEKGANCKMGTTVYR